MRLAAALCFVLSCVSSACAQQQPGLTRRDEAPAKKAVLPPPPAALKAPASLEPARAGNADGVYQTLRQRSPNGASFAVKDLTLQRDAGVFTLKSGTVVLFPEVGGKLTGAVFEGEG